MSQSYEEQIIQEYQSIVYQQKHMIETLIRVQESIAAWIDAEREHKEVNHGEKEENSAQT